MLGVGGYVESDDETESGKRQVVRARHRSAVAAEQRSGVIYRSYGNLPQFSRREELRHQKPIPISFASSFPTYQELEMQFEAVEQSAAIEFKRAAGPRDFQKSAQLVDEGLSRLQQTEGEHLETGSQRTADNEDATEAERVKTTSDKSTNFVITAVPLCHRIIVAIISTCVLTAFCTLSGTVLNVVEKRWAREVVETDLVTNMHNVIKKYTNDGNRTTLQVSLLAALQKNGITSIRSSSPNMMTWSGGYYVIWTAITTIGKISTTILWWEE
jgi:hypothetical protein